MNRLANCLIAFVLLVHAPALAFEDEDPDGFLLNESVVAGDVEDAADDIAGLREQLDQQSLMLAELHDRLSRYEAIYSESGFPQLGPGECNVSCDPRTRRLPLVFEETVPPCERASSETFRTLNFYADYDKGFAILPFDLKKTPYSLRINGWIQFRHHAFSRNEETWTDSAGVERQIRNRNAFDIERARLYFKGNAVDERLTYFYHLDADSDGRHTVDFFDYWWSWKCSDSFRLQFGKRKVSASRHWLLGARRTRFVDRPMTNDFFRPDRTLGIYGLGKIGDRSTYEVMVGNGYRTANLPNNVTDDQLTYAATYYFDPFGDYGSQVVDYDCSESLLARIGHSFVYSPMDSDSFGIPLDETDFLRLTDGTRLTQVGALAPDTTVTDVDLYFYSVDFAWKYRGWSFTSEVFFRWLNELRGDNPLPHRDLFQRGFFVEGGTFLIPKKLDANFRYSEVRGLFGDASEYAAGVNWYPVDSHKFKITFDVTLLDGSPLQNTAADILVGDDGALFRTQFQAEF